MKKEKNKNIPDKVEIITMPRLSGWTTGLMVSTWLKKIGDVVSKGDILAEIETDKATIEFECFYEGTILYIGVQEGETAPVDSLLTIIGPAGTDISVIVNEVFMYNAPKEKSKKDSIIFGEKLSPDDILFYKDEEINSSNTIEWLDTYIKKITKKKYVKGRKIKKMIAVITKDLETELPNFNYVRDEEPDNLPF